MLQKMKGAIASAKDFASNLMKNHSRRLVSSLVALAMVILAGLCSVHTFTVSDGETKYTLKSSSANTESALKMLPLESSDYEVTKVISKFLSTDIEISYIVPLTVKVGSSASTYSVRSGLLRNILDTIGITLDEHDIVSLSLDSFIKSRSSVEITDVEYVAETVYETIKNGSTGTKVMTCSVKYVNGERVSSTIIDETVSEYAIDSMTVVDSSAPHYATNGVISAANVSRISKLDVPEDLFLDANGVPVEYSSKTTLRATAYTHTGNKCSTGVYPTPGYVAVDPKEIPYGTKMYIVSADGKYHYGYAIAADTGGFIYGTRTDMDLFLDTESQCVTFGRRDIIV